MAGTAVLYLAPVARTFAELHASLEHVSWLDAHIENGATHWRGSGLDIRFELVSDAEAAAQRTRDHHFALVIVDCRQLGDVSDAEAARQERALHYFLDAVRDEGDPDLRYPFERIAVLVGGRDVNRTDRLLFDAGAHHVGLFLRDASLRSDVGESQSKRARNELLHELWDLAQTVMTGRKLGSKALCAAGGGITGIYYELGVLKCLQDAFGDFTMGDFDTYYGISAGAIVTALLANGQSVDDIIERIGGTHGEALDIQLGMRHLNVRDTPLRIRSAVEQVGAYLGRVRAGEERFNVPNLMWQVSALLGPVFRGNEVERRFRSFFEAPGRTNRFDELERELFIGATDQDAREHVLFGDAQHRDVPISKAVQASTAIYPFFRSVEIDGRYYTDGYVTRTSNLSAAVDHGAKLIVVIDPFLPLVTDVAGASARHGLFWGVLQDYKTVAFTRFNQVTNQILRQNPQVTAFTFLPSNRMRRLMSSNPMAASHFDAIVVEAYRSTYRRLRRIEHKLGPRMEEHDIHVDLGVVADTVARTTRRGRPRVRVLLEESANARARALPRIEPAPRRAAPASGVHAAKSAS